MTDYSPVVQAAVGLFVLSKLGSSSEAIVCPTGYHPENGKCIQDNPPIDTVPPYVVINAPNENEEVEAGQFTVSGTAGDNVQLASVRVGIFDVTEQITIIPYKQPTGLTAWSTNFTLSTPGPFVIKAEGTDAAGNKIIEERKFTIIMGDTGGGGGGGGTSTFDQYGILKIYGDSSPADTRTTYRYNRTQGNTRDQFIFDDVDWLPMEVTCYEKVSFFADDERGFKVWGGNHSGSGDNNTTRQGRCYGAGINRNGTPHLMKEYEWHPNGDYSLENSKLKYVNPAFPKSGSLPTLGQIDGRTIGHKYVIYLKDNKAFMEYYVDTAPFVSGKPQNQWQLMYTAVDDHTWVINGKLSEVYTANQGVVYGGDGKVFIRNDDTGTSGSSTPGTTEYGYTVRKIDPTKKLKTFTGQW